MQLWHGVSRLRAINFALLRAYPCIDFHAHLLNKTQTPAISNHPQIRTKAKQKTPKSNWKKCKSNECQRTSERGQRRQKQNFDGPHGVCLTTSDYTLPRIWRWPWKPPPLWIANKWLNGAVPWDERGVLFGSAGADAILIAYTYVHTILVVTHFACPFIIPPRGCSNFQLWQVRVKEKRLKRHSSFT